ncbi:V-type ATP synthase subunit D [subsurface metagenome]
MAEEKIKLNKTELKNQKDLLKQREEFLPVLELKKQQLQIVVDAITPQMEQKQAQITSVQDGMSGWARFLTEDIDLELEELYHVLEVRTDTENIAGVDVPAFDQVVFRDVEYDLFTFPPWVDRAQEELRKLRALVEEVRVLMTRRELLTEELRQTTIRVNLFEKLLIPEHRRNIKKIGIYLGDQEVAAISIAKIAKGKLSKSESTVNEPAMNEPAMSEGMRSEGV